MSRCRAVPAVLAALAACVFLVGCGRATGLPSPTATDFGGMVDRLTKAGITVSSVVSGDAGCPDASLAKTAIAFDASGLDQLQPVRMRVYVFRDHDTWQRLSGSVATCAQSYVTDPATYESLAPSPYVVSGQGPWAADFAAALKTAFTVAAGSGD